MKKILTISLFIFALNSTSAYILTDSDRLLLNSFSEKIELLYENNPSKVESIKSKLDNLLLTLKTNTRNYLIFKGISDNIQNLVDEDNGIFEYEVVSVIDGDTVNINYEGEEKSIRMIGIDAPESMALRFGYIECYGKESSDYLKDKLNGKTIKLEFDETQGKYDKYNRLLGYVWLEGENINQEIIKNGYGFEYTYDENYKYISDFQEAEDYAQENKLGLWNEKFCNGERKEVEVEEAEYIQIDWMNWASANNANCDSSKNCGDMVACEEAYFYLNSCGQKSLDRDDDGIPCESLCN